MRVCVVCREHPTLHFNGGLSIAAWNTARVAMMSGAQVDFVTSRYPDGQGADANTVVRSVMQGVQVICLPDGDHADYSKWHPAITKWFEEGHIRNYDLIHCHGYSGSTIARKGPGIPILFHDHGSKAGYLQTVMTDQVLRVGPGVPAQLVEFYNQTYNGSPAPAGEADFVHMRRYDRVIATSHISEMDFRTRYCLTNVDLFYHPIFLDEDLVKVGPAKTCVPPVVAVFAGDLDNPWKCGVQWLQELEPMKDRIQLTLIGKGRAVVEYALKTFPKSYATGHLSEEKALRVLSKADVLYEPSTHHIGLNLTGISAIGMGVPVVAFPTAGHYDLIGDIDGTGEESGVLVDPHKPDGVVDAIERVLDCRERYSMFARRRFCEKFHPKVAMARISDIYEKVARMKGFGE